MRTSLIAASALAFAAAMIAPVDAAVIGDTLSCDVTGGGSGFCVQPTATIGSGAEFQISGGNGPYLSVDFSDKLLTITSIFAGTFPSSYTVLNFKDLTHPFDHLSFISSNGFDLSSGSGQISPSKASLIDGNLMIDLRGTRIQQGATLVFAVPEAASWAMMIGGVGVIGFAMRSRKRQTARVTYA
jgi:hypothetical protein